MALQSAPAGREETKNLRSNHKNQLIGGAWVNLENLSIRQRICESGLYLYQIAERMRISPNKLSCMICRPLKPDDAERILQAINDISKNGVTHGD